MKASTKLVGSAMMVMAVSSSAAFVYAAQASAMNSVQTVLVLVDGFQLVRDSVTYSTATKADEAGRKAILAERGFASLDVLKKRIDDQKAEGKLAASELVKTRYRLQYATLAACVLTPLASLMLFLTGLNLLRKPRARSGDQRNVDAGETSPVSEPAIER